MAGNVATRHRIPMDATYFRYEGRTAARIRYRRIRDGRPTKSVNTKARRSIARVAYVTFMLAPDEVDSILEMPSRLVGRMLKSALRHKKRTARKRGLVRRRPKSCVFRIAREIRDETATPSR